MGLMDELTSTTTRRLWALGVGVSFLLWRNALIQISKNFQTFDFPFEPDWIE